jgi:hypothetical protein
MRGSIVVVTCSKGGRECKRDGGREEAREEGKREGEGMTEK